MAQKDGKYLIVKDPNKAMIRFGFKYLLQQQWPVSFRLYDIPDGTFESEEDTDESEEGMFWTTYFVWTFEYTRGACFEEEQILKR